MQRRTGVKREKQQQKAFREELAETGGGGLTEHLSPASLQRNSEKTHAQRVTNSRN
jgi:hypothetical protein